MTTHDQIKEIAREDESDVMVIGVHGWKKEGSDITVVGSAIGILSYDPVCPFLLVKNREERASKEDGAFRWGVCLDGSENSYRGLKQVLTLCDKSKDFIDMIHVRKLSISAETVEEQGK